VRFRVLGPFEADADGRLVALGRRRERCLLAVLVLNPGRVIPVTRLVELLWEDDQPDRAHRHVHTHVARLRAVLNQAPGGDPPRIVTAGVGYRLDTDPETIDAHRFRTLVNDARGVAGAEHKSAVLRTALALWRGPALADIATERFRDRVCGELEELRLRALEDRIAADLDLGRAADVVAELDTLTASHPFRERPQALLMLALHRAGRQVEALQRFRTNRARLVDALGVEPSAPLRQLHEALLRADERLNSMPAAGLVDLAGTIPAGTVRHVPVVPRELPADVGGFTGRQGQLDALDEVMRTAGSTVVISAIAGTAGVGKTALAVHWAHRSADRFPDGQLYVDLRGYSSGAPLRPVEALNQVLRSLGVPTERIPHEEGSAAALYRSTLAGRKVLVLLDNARAPEQVRPLLPGCPGCLVVVTSRDQLGGLVAMQGARRINLDVLTPAEAEALLIRIVGPADPAAIAELARLCAYLPLALRIAAANVTGNPHLGVDGYLAELTGGDRLAALAMAGDKDAAVRRAFDVSYRSVPAGARRLFRLLGLAAGPDITAPAAAALAGTGTSAATRLLDVLARAHLIEEHQPGRYTCHDLLRLYAARRAERDEPEPGRGAAIRRLSEWYWRLADAADRLLYPHSTRLPVPVSAVDLPVVTFTDHATALGWLDAERVNLVAICTAAAEHGPRPVAWLLADTLRRYLNRHRHLADLFAVAEAGLAAARTAGERRAAAATHVSLAIAYATGVRRSRKAIAHFGRTLTLSRRAGWPKGQYLALNGLGVVHYMIGRLDRAVDFHQQALELSRQVGHKGGQATSLNNLALSYRDAGQLGRALAVATAAQPLYREMDAVGAAANARHTLGTALRLLGRFDLALDQFDLALNGFRAVGDRDGEASALIGLARVRADTGRHHEALDGAREALGLTDGAGEHQVVVDSSNTLAAAHRDLGRDCEAIERHEVALAVATDIGYHFGVAEAKVGLAATHHQAGHHRLAVKLATDTLGIARRAGFRVLEGQTLGVLAAIAHGSGEHDQAIAHARRALVLHRATGHRLGEAHTLVLLGQVLHQTSAVDGAFRHWRQARELLAGIGAPEPDELRAQPALSKVR
jgi:DNA-binding SARP family transcriptional activator/tetratricopeptide (TPR) repeat protein